MHSLRHHCFHRCFSSVALSLFLYYLEDFIQILFLLCLQYLTYLTEVEAFTQHYTSVVADTVNPAKAHFIAESLARLTYSLAISLSIILIFRNFFQRWHCLLSVQRKHHILPSIINYTAQSSLRIDYYVNAYVKAPNKIHGSCYYLRKVLA